jgi:hypothetical protein|tara:strand:- start:565 stop:681 length:117 start_codon:yes stop_codon:yes gene_type:complete
MPVLVGQLNIETIIDPLFDIEEQPFTINQMRANLEQIL